MSFTVRTVRELKGAPLACYVLILLAGQPVTNEWLCMFSGYTDKPVSKALKLLSSPEYKLVRRARRGWIIDQDSQQVLPSKPKSRKNSVPTTTILINQEELINDVVVVSRKKSDSDYDACLEACKNAGIFNPSASEISDLEHVTPDFIAAHIADLQPGETRGLAILRIKNNEPPASWAVLTESDPESAPQCPAGAFGEFINV